MQVTRIEPITDTSPCFRSISAMCKAVFTSRCLISFDLWTGQRTCPVRLRRDEV